MSKPRVLWTLFVVQIALTLSSVTGIFSGSFFTLVVTYMPLLLLVVHACWVLRMRRGLAFIALAAFTGWAAEAVSLHAGTLFGGTYIYPEQTSLYGVPLTVITYWAVFIYTGYWLVSSFVYWLGKTKPSYTQGNGAFLVLLILADGLAVTAIDLFMDPISVRAGSWTWLDGGPYFGVPIGNFIGWFTVTVIVTGLFRIFEYCRPPKALTMPPSVLLLPVLGYLLVGVNFLSAALTYHMPLLAIIGTVLVIVPASINLGLYARTKRSPPKQLLQ